MLLTASVERQLTGEVAVAQRALKPLEGPGATVLQQATLKAVGWEGGHGDGEEGREPRGIWALEGHLGRKAGALWPLAQGTVESSARLPQAEVHLHGQGLLPAIPRPNVPLELERLAAHPTLAGKAHA